MKSQNSQFSKRKGLKESAEAGKNRNSAKLKAKPKSNEEDYQKYCEKLFKEQLKLFKINNSTSFQDQNLKNFIDYAAEISTEQNSNFNFNHEEKIKINKGALLAVLLSFTVLKDEILLKKIIDRAKAFTPVADQVANIAATTTTGLAVGGLAGAALGAMAGMALPADAKKEKKKGKKPENLQEIFFDPEEPKKPVEISTSQTTSKPSKSITEVTSNKLANQQKSAKKKYFDITPLKKARLTDEQIFIASTDWVLTAKGLMPIRESSIVQDTLKFDFHYVFIKNHDLEKVVREDDFEGFKKIISKAVSQLKEHFDRSETLYSFLLESTQDKVKEGLTSSKVLEHLVKGISEITGLKVSQVGNAIVKTLEPYEAKPLDIFAPEFSDSLKNNLRKIIFQRFEDESSLEPMFDELQQDKKVKPNTSYQEALEKFHQLEWESFEREVYTDRIKKLAKFVSSPFSNVLYIDLETPPALKYTLGLSLIQMGSVFIIPDDAVLPHLPKALAHESMHRSDYENCNTRPNGKISFFQEQLPINNLIIHPCGDLENKDMNFYKKLLFAYEKDVKAFHDQGMASKNPEAAQQLQRDEALITSLNERSKSAEILTTFTDSYHPNVLMGLFPNIAVSRSYITLKDTVEDQFFAALMQCNFQEVKKILREDGGEILEQKYDQIPFSEIAKKTVEFDFDYRVDQSLKANKESSYKKINDYVQAKFQQFKKEKSSAESSLAI